MAVKPRSGLSAPHHDPAALAAYVVLVTPGNGMKIAGKRRAQGDTFHAHPRHMAFLTREGVVAPAVPAAAG